MKASCGDMMRATTKYFLITLALLAAGLAVFATQFSLHSQVERRIVAALEAQGLSHVKVSVAELDKQHVLFSRIAFSKEKMKVAAEDLNLLATALPVVELLRGNVANIKVDWAVKSMSVTGIAYDLPPLTGAGNYYMKDGKPVVTGEMHDEKRTHRADFTVTSTTALLENIRVLWQQATLSAKEVVISLQEKKTILIPLQVRNLPLPTLLALISSDKATGTGTVSGKVNILIKPDGSFMVSNGKFAAEKTGLIQLSPSALPGEGPQMDMARTALGNFHYKDLSLRLDEDKRGKALIQLDLQGNNPEAFNGRPIKLHVNLSGDVLELLQHTILPMANPTDLIEKENQ